MTTPEIRTGYHPTLIGQITQLHAAYYADLVGFGLPFEAKVATELSEFCTRLDAAENETWSVWQNGTICGGVTIDGQDLGPTTAHLRWFILSTDLAGHGLGTQLLNRAIDFCRAQGKSDIHLWTFQGLPAARHLYEKAGFTLAEETPGTAWGKEVLEQKFTLTLQGS